MQIQTRKHCIWMALTVHLHGLYIRVLSKSPFLCMIFRKLDTCRASNFDGRFWHGLSFWPCRQNSCCIEAQHTYRAFFPHEQLQHGWLSGVADQILPIHIFRFVKVIFKIRPKELLPCLWHQKSNFPILQWFKLHGYFITKAIFWMEAVHDQKFIPCKGWNRKIYQKKNHFENERTFWISEAHLETVQIFFCRWNFNEIPWY